jgi:hypothetical protein
MNKIEEPRFYLHNYPSFSFLLPAISYLVSMFLSLDWRADHVFIASFQRKSWCLVVTAMERKKGVVPPS